MGAKATAAEAANEVEQEVAADQDFAAKVVAMANEELAEMERVSNERAEESKANAVEGKTKNPRD